MKEIKEKELFWIYYNNFFYGEDFKVDEFGWHKNEPNYTYTDLRTNNIIQFVNNGTCYFIIEDDDKKETFTLHKGDAIIIKSGIKHTCISDKDDTCGRYWLSCSGTEINSIMKQVANMENYAIVRNIDTKKLAKNFSILKANMRNDLIAGNNIISTAYLLFNLIAETNISKFRKINNEKDKENGKIFIDSVVKYIDNHIKENITVKNLVDYFGYERTYFYKLFKKHSGVSIQQYITRRRIGIARTLIAETDKSFREIAEEVGYTNYSSFYKMFCLITNSSPEEYKNLYGKNKTN